MEEEFFECEGAYNNEFSPLRCVACGTTIGNACDPYADPGCRECDRRDQEAEYEAELMAEASAYEAACQTQMHQMEDDREEWEASDDDY